MPASPFSDLDVNAELEELIREVYAEDMARARSVIDAAISAADEQWIPRYAMVGALLSKVRDMTQQPDPSRQMDS